MQGLGFRARGLGRLIGRGLFINEQMGPPHDGSILAHKGLILAH